MLRLPAVAGQFYPANPRELARLIRQYTTPEAPLEKVPARACIVPHAGYVYSGGVAGAVFSRLILPRKIVVVGVRHRPPGADLAIVSHGRSEEHTSELQSRRDLVCRLLLEKKKKKIQKNEVEKKKRKQEKK